VCGGLAHLALPAASVCEEPRAVSEGAVLTEAGVLDRIQRAAFAYSWLERDRASGLVYNTTEPQAPASPTAAGIALSAIPIGIERGWITREEGYERARQLLDSLGRAEHVKGFFYHFLNPADGARTWHSEVSCIDSAILFAGAMVIAQYFPGTEVDAQANALLHRAEWPWFLDGEDTFRWSWTPETGFEDGFMSFSESILAYLLAMGSPTHPIPPASWDALRRPISRAAGRAMVYTTDGSLFAYLLPLAWFDLRDRHDASLDYWTNARTAILANRQFCQDHQAQFRTYREGLWGLSAALGPYGYKAYGAPPAAHPVHDGTVAPSVVAASIPWFPQDVLETLRRMEALRPALWTQYGLGDALNVDLNFVSPHTIALDQGLALLMIENYRTSLVWRLFMSHPVAVRAMEAAGFVPGSLDEPVPPAVIPGNPGDSLTVQPVGGVTIDADLAEWLPREPVEVTPTGRRHVESGTFHSAQDASILVYTGWAPGRLYLAAIVVDDELVTRATEDRIYEDDCLELFWDLDGDGFRFDGNPQDVQVGLAPSGPEGTRQLWAWGALRRRPHEVEAAAKQEGNRVIVELGIPMTLLPGLAAGPDSPARFSVAYHDRDTDGRAGKLHWSVDTASVPGTIVFGRMTLELPD